MADVFLARQVSINALVQRLSSLLGLVLAVSLAVFSLSVQAQTTMPVSLPAWLQSRITTIENSPFGSEPDEVWQFEYQGKTVYYFLAPCCDQFNRLYSADGKYLCAPNGGFLGVGDQRCPDAIPKRNQRKRVWRDPRLDKN
jgi:hypothetical protein